MFGGGMGHMGETCGVVTGAFMVIGLRYSKIQDGENEKRDAGYKLIQEFTHRFEARNGSTVCRELLGRDISTEEGLAQARESGAFSSICPKLVQDAIDILEQLLE
jgi:C_GCAxxG_C_C family probable redox protein